MICDATRDILKVLAIIVDQDKHIEYLEAELRRAIELSEQDQDWSEAYTISRLRWPR